MSSERAIASTSTVGTRWQVAGGKRRGAVRNNEWRNIHNNYNNELFKFFLLLFSVVVCLYNIFSTVLNKYIFNTAHGAASCEASVRLVACLKFHPRVCWLVAFLERLVAHLANGY